MLSADYNGELTASNFLCKQILVAAGTGTVAGVDLKDFIGNVKLTLNWAGAAADGSHSLAINFLDSADNTTYTTITDPTFAAQTASSGTVSTSLDTRLVRRYVQARYLTASATATFTTSIVGVGLKQVI